MGRKNKRFLLFGGETYYAIGGVYDLLSSHDTLEDATIEAQRTEYKPLMDWWHVFDTETGEVVAC